MLVFFALHRITPSVKSGRIGVSYMAYSVGRQLLRTHSVYYRTHSITRIKMDEFVCINNVVDRKELFVTLNEEPMFSCELLKQLLATVFTEIKKTLSHLAC